jgi:hypothetical protein
MPWADSKPLVDAVRRRKAKAISFLYNRLIFFIQGIEGFLLNLLNTLKPVSEAP